MNKQKFIESLRNPGNVTEQDLTSLEAIVTESPYFQSAHALLARASRSQKNPNTKKYIASAATYATDRIHLKKYLSGELVLSETISGHESHEATYDVDRSEELKEAKSTSIQNKIKSNPTISESSTHSPVSKKEVEAPQVSTTTPPKQETPPTQPVSEPSKPKREFPVVEIGNEPPSDLDNLISELYKDMEELKVNRKKLEAYEQKIEEEEAVNKAVKKATKKEEEKSQKTDSSKKKAVTKKEKPKETKPATAKSKPVAKATTSKKTTATKKSTAKSSSAAKKTTKSSTPAKKKTTKSTGTTTAATKKKATSSSRGKKSKPENTDKKDDKGDPQKSEQHEIIASFIQNAPSISKADKTKKNDVDLSGSSTEFNPEIASEYLAEIYLNQGKKDRAFQIYETLIVKNPEKKAYFADIIQKLKE